MSTGPQEYLSQVDLNLTIGKKRSFFFLTINPVRYRLLPFLVYSWGYWGTERLKKHVQDLPWRQIWLQAGRLPSPHLELPQLKPLIWGELPLKIGCDLELGCLLCNSHCINYSWCTSGEPVFLVPSPISKRGLIHHLLGVFSKPSRLRGGWGGGTGRRNEVFLISLLGQIV